MENTIILKNEQETQELGKRLAEQFKPNTVVALTGDLGAGKTALAKAIARGLGVTETITSPTFTIVQEYETGRLPLFHFDVYRVSDEDELFEIGFEDYFKKGGICLIEWADLVEDMLPAGAVHIEMLYGEEEGERICRIA